MLTDKIYNIIICSSAHYFKFEKLRWKIFLRGFKVTFNGGFGSFDRSVRIVYFQTGSHSFLVFISIIFYLTAFWGIPHFGKFLTYSLVSFLLLLVTCNRLTTMPSEKIHYINTIVLLVEFCLFSWSSICYLTEQQRFSM